MKLGVVGLPNVGKSTLFNAITHAGAQAANFPFTSPKPCDIPKLDTDPASVLADAYDMVCNGVEVGGGSIRIHDAELQAKIFKTLGFTPERAKEQFGFLMNAFKYGAPPHGGLWITSHAVFLYFGSLGGSGNGVV